LLKDFLLTYINFSYFQVHPLAYLIKLNIELSLADLIAKIVQATNPLNIVDFETSQQQHQPNINDSPYPEDAGWHRRN